MSIMNLNNQVWEIMTTELTTVAEDTPLNQVKDLMRKNMIHHLPVENSEGEVVGIVSSEDLKRTSHFTMPEKEMRAKHIMTVNPFRVSVDTPIKKVVDCFLDNRFRAILVVNNDNEEAIIGIVTPYDVMQGLMRNFESTGIDSIL
jgi:CBS domain-containing protein